MISIHEPYNKLYEFNEDKPNLIYKYFNHLAKLTNNLFVINFFDYPNLVE